MLRKFFDPALQSVADLARSLGATMLFQSGQNFNVNYKLETTFAVAAAGGAGATRLRATGGGLSLARATINPNDMRADMRTSMGRYGSRNVSGSYPTDLAVGGVDALIEAALRGTFAAASAVTAATFTTLAPAVTTGNSGTFTAAAGSFITQGFRVGQVVRRTGSALAANNGRNLRVSGVTATLLTFTTSDGLPITGGAADATGSLDIQKRVIQGNPVVRRSFTFEEYGADMDETELFIGGRIATMRMSGGPDQMATVEFGIVGADEQALLPAASPYFTAPTVPSGIGLTLADAVIRFGGVDVAVLTSADFTLDNRQAGQAVIGGGVTPDVFEGRAAITGSVSAIRQDLGYVRKYLAETELELQLLFVEPEAEPKDYISVFIPRIKLGTPTKTLGADGALIETLPFITGNKDATTGYDDTMIQVETSAP
jgi:hypothetical protein